LKEYCWETLLVEVEKKLGKENSLLVGELPKNILGKNILEKYSGKKLCLLYKRRVKQKM
jgi:hypothetical protein